MFLTNREPDEAVVVGDASYDMEMAVNAGVTPIGVSWGYQTPAMLEAAGAQEVVHSIAELRHVILDHRPWGGGPMTSSCLH